MSKPTQPQEEVWVRFVSVTWVRMSTFTTERRRQTVAAVKGPLSFLFTCWRVDGTLKQRWRWRKSWRGCEQGSRVGSRWGSQGPWRTWAPVIGQRHASRGSWRAHRGRGRRSRWWRLDWGAVPKKNKELIKRIKNANRQENHQSRILLTMATLEKNRPVVNGVRSSMYERFGFRKWRAAIVMTAVAVDGAGPRDWCSDRRIGRQARERGRRGRRRNRFWEVRLLAFLLTPLEARHQRGHHQPRCAPTAGRQRRAAYANVWRSRIHN